MFKKFLIFSVLSFLVVSLGTPLYKKSTVSAVTASDWRAGRIIDDSVFTDNNAMSPEQIQSFLNYKVGTGGYDSVPGQCDTYGSRNASPYSSSTRAQYAASLGRPTTFTCLSNYYEVPKTSPGPGIPANNYGGAPIPAGARSAAQLIYDAAQANRISPKVLLVKIQKESAGPLTTDDWPFQKQYTYAMGAHCPDSGPGGAANCDSNYAGFSIQVAESASLLRYYLDNMSQPWWPYKKLGNNDILYQNSKPECGSSTVNITTQATAALYTYTPYQPNQAALNNMYGTGDACSAYGNRNFWRIFNDWFGSVNGPAYNWQLVSQEAYSDALRANYFTSTPTVQPGKTAYLRIKVLNNGYLPWDRSFLSLGTSAPHDRASQLTNSSWISNSRPAKLIEQQVEPGQIGTFEFSVTAPNSNGTHREYFNLVADGQTWLNDIGLYYDINVVSPVAPIATINSKLEATQELKTSEYKLSQDTQSILVVQADGNVVLYSDFNKVIWNTSTAGKTADKLIMQSDGNLVLYSKTGSILWHSATYGNPGARLVLQTDNNLVIYNQSNTPIWSINKTHNPDHLAYVNTTLYGASIIPNQSLDTADRRYKLIQQTDGNLVVYSPYRPVWATSTVGGTKNRLTLQNDGNLVLYNTNNQPLWQSATYGRGSSKLVIQQDGNLVLYDTFDRPTWSSGTAGKQ